MQSVVIELGEEHFPLCISGMNNIDEELKKCDGILFRVRNW